MILKVLWLWLGRFFVGRSRSQPQLLATSCRYYVLSCQETMKTRLIDHDFKSSVALARPLFRGAEPVPPPEGSNPLSTPDSF